MTVAALYVCPRGPYANRPEIDLWDEARDARTYAGPWPVIAHPPCQRWGKFYAGSPAVIARTGQRFALGEDGGCFAAALASVRRFGGVLEHPEHSQAWGRFGLSKPPRSGGWVPADNHGGYTCRVEQGRYGHYARKPTWLYAVRAALPELAWGVSSWTPSPALIAKMGGEAAARRLGEMSARGGGRNSPCRIHTPPQFVEVLLDMARSAIQ